VPVPRESPVRVTDGDAERPTELLADKSADPVADSVTEPVADSVTDGSGGRDVDGAEPIDPAEPTDGAEPIEPADPVADGAPLAEPVEPLGAGALEDPVRPPLAEPDGDGGTDAVALDDASGCEVAAPVVGDGWGGSTVGDGA